MAMGLRGPLANSQGLFGSVIFPKGFLATILQLYHENRPLVGSALTPRSH